MKKDVMVLTGAGQIGMAIARRMGYGKKIVIGDKKPENAQAIAKIMDDAGFDVEAMEMDLSSRESIKNLIAKAQEYGEIAMLVNAAGVSPSQAPIEAILKVDLYGTAVLLEEVGKVIKEGGVGVTISSQSGHRMPALTPEEDEQLACTPTEELLSLDILQPENIKDTLHAYQMAKRCNEKRVMAESVKWGEKRRPDQFDLSGNYCDHLWQSMNLADRAAISIKTCSRNARQGVRELRMRWQMWRSFL